LITGGARRVGAALCLYFAKNGYDIALHYRQSKEEAAAVKQQVEALGAACELFACDLADTVALPGLMSNVVRRFGRCDVLVNNASVFERAEFLETDEALFDRQMNINFKAPFFLTQAFAKQCKNGVVINLLDTDIAQIGGSHFIYLLSKKALAECTVMAARQLGPEIRVNGVCPGYVLPHSASDAAYIKEVEKTLPLKEHATVDEITEAVFWLCQQKHITGQIIYIDGGQHVS
jgi:NAD(P)-dependent dehydrogenase (short-subunit alcohol dehydrogenase family)